MIVMILERTPPAIRGELTRWLLEPYPGVFVGHVSARVREELWEKCCLGCKGGGVVLIWTTNTEQRYAMRTYGKVKREVVEMEGLQLIRIPKEK